MAVLMQYILTVLLLSVGFTSTSTFQGDAEKYITQKTHPQLSHLTAQFNLLKQEMAQMKSANVELLQEMNAMKVTNSQLLKEVGTLHLVNSNLEKQMSEMKMANHNVHQLNAKLVKDINAIKLANSELKKEMGGVKLAYSELKKEVGSIVLANHGTELHGSKTFNRTDFMNFIKADDESVKDDGLLSMKNIDRAGENVYSNGKMAENLISFTAYASQDRDYNSGDRVLFDTVLRNYGDAYDATESTFTCPVKGYYLIAISVFSEADLGMHAQIQLDDEELLVAFADKDFDQGSSTLVTLCDVGQVVAVYCTHNDDRLVAENKKSSFTIVLLRIT